MQSRGARWQARMRMIGIVTLGLLGAPAGCGFNAGAICQNAGGTYVGDTCTHWTPYQQALETECEKRGGVYLVGQGRCAFGEGGP